MRAELTPTELAEHLAKRAELWEAREVSGQVDPKPQGGKPTLFASEAEAKTGVPKRTVNRAISRAKATRQAMKIETM
jgi:hypothetical protein